MISIVCVYNNEKILNNVLLKSLKNQTAKFELIPLDNRNKKFKSAAEALNYGGEKAGGDYIMFVHQDMWLGYDAYLEDAEKILNTITDLGVAGVAGMSEKYSKWEDKIKYSIDIFGIAGFDKTTVVKKPEEVHTLDECLLIIPASVFKKIRFDEKTFDGWDCYGADYSLSVKKINLKAYVIPGSCSHCTIRGSYSIWEFENLYVYQKRLYHKHKKNFPKIYTFIGCITIEFLLWLKILNIIKPLYFKIFPDFSFHLERELEGCNTVLDIGCGHLSPLSKCNIPYSIGVDIFYPSIQESKRSDIHNQYICGDIRSLEFKPESFDAIVAIDILQNLTKKEGIQLLKKMEQWSKGKILIKIPNKYFKRDIKSSNSSMEHKSEWTVKELKDSGFKIRGIGGWKIWKRDEDYRDIQISAVLREIILNLTQKIVYFYPKLALHLFIIKKIDKKNDIIKNKK